MTGNVIIMINIKRSLSPTHMQSPTYCIKFKK